MKIKKSVVLITAGILAATSQLASAGQDNLEDVLAENIFDDTQGSFVNVAVNDAELDASVTISEAASISMGAINTVEGLATNAIETSVLGAANTGSIRIGENEYYDMESFAGSLT